MACLICGDHVAPIFVNETWAGTLHSACNHGACEGCVRDSIAADLPRCRAEGLLRVRCFAPGCPKVLPQTLVFHISSGARGLALEIDRHANQLEKFYNKGPVDWIPRNCTVCNDYCGPTLRCTGCDYGACECCTGRWVDEQLPRCTVHHRLLLRCFNPNCDQGIDEDVALHVSAAARNLKKALKKRSQLQNNTFYPAEVQVDCPQLGCVGLGYLGFDTVMCFLCEHQWLAVEGDAPVEDLPGTLKACTNCHTQIEKNGGCDHMTCRCGYEFFWSTLLPYKPNASVP